MVNVNGERLNHSHFVSDVVFTANSAPEINEILQELNARRTEPKN